jgi:nitrogen-specific signal transduction histidine kinase
MNKGDLVLGYEGVWLDVTRQTIAEKRLSSAAWKETLAVLTMGLAHDFSNVMAGIHSISESFLAQIDAQNPFHEGMSLIRQNSLQASQLVQRIINLHHGKTGERNYHDLNEIVGGLVELGRKIIPRRIEITIELARNRCHVDLA